MELSHEDVEEITLLESAMWRNATRWDRDFMEATLHPDFHEVGKSGRLWTRAQVIDTVPVTLAEWAPLADLEIAEIGPGVVLVRYRSEPGEWAVSAHRTSVWVREGGRWLMRFHQGTPIPGR